MARRYTPEQLKPMACSAVSKIEELPDREGGWIIEPKLDGFRLLAVIEEDHVDFLTRGLKWQNGKLPNVEKALLERFPPGTVLDGEVVAFRDATEEERAEGKPRIVNDFEHVQSIMLSNPDVAVMKAKLVRPLTYMAFDVMAFDGHDTTMLPLKKRKHFLMRQDPKHPHDSPDFQRTPYFRASREQYDAIVEAGFEGAVCKDRNSTYHFGEQGHGWVKIKHQWTMDAIVVGFVPGRGKNFGKVGSIVFAQPTNDPQQLAQGKKVAEHLQKMYTNEHTKGKVATEGVHWFIGYNLDHLAVRGCARGFNDSIMDAMTADPEAYFGRVVEIAHNGLMAGEIKVRHPQFLRFRDPEDKPVNEVTWSHR